MHFRDVNLLCHDCNQLGESAGACIVDLESHQVIGLHLSGRYMETRTAVPLWELVDDPLCRRCDVTFGEADPSPRQNISSIDSPGRAGGRKSKKPSGSYTGAR